MDQQIIKTVSKQIYRQFPYLSDAEPEVSTLEGNNTLLLYKGNAVTADGHEFPVLVRVVINSTGKVLKITSSR